MKVYAMKNIPFPDCFVDCEMIQFLGVGECESVCSWKFDKDGQGLAVGEIRQISDKRWDSIMYNVKHGEQNVKT